MSSLILRLRRGVCDDEWQGGVVSRVEEGVGGYRWRRMGGGDEPGFVLELGAKVGWAGFGYVCCAERAQAFIGNGVSFCVLSVWFCLLLMLDNSFRV